MGSPYKAQVIDDNLKVRVDGTVSFTDPNNQPYGAVAISGTPSAGQVITATSATTADWETPAAGGPLLSWFDTSLAAPITTLGATAAVAFDSPFDELKGSDFSISGDGKTVTINTTGLYGAAAFTNFLASGGTAAGTALVEFAGASGSSSNDPLRINGPISTQVLINGAIGLNLFVTHTIPPIYMTATATIQVLCGATMSVGSCKLQNVDWIMQRVA